MRKAVGVAWGILLLAMLVGFPMNSFAEEKVSTRPADMNKAPGETGDKQKDSKCDKIADNDERNLCRAFTRDEFNSDKDKQNRYANKDHSYYYCTLIKDKDKQTYCYGVVRNQRSMCGNIIDSKLEKDCLAKTK